MDCVAFYDSPLGKITLTSDGESLTGLYLEGDRFFSLSQKSQEKNLPIFDETRRWLDLYFSGKNPNFTPPLLMQSTPFRQSVWKILLKIPFGKTTSYGEIAKQIGRKMSAQAVGNAVGHNAIAIIIPCHRVVGKNGNLTGYAAGIDKKIKLLELEKVDVSKFFIPKNAF